jgi:alpha-mannosidase
VVLSPLDTPLVTLGGMTGSTWPKQLNLKRAHVFAYAMNNYWHTNYKAEQGGRHVFRFSLTSSRGNFAPREAVRQGWELFCPPVAGRGQDVHKPVLSAAAEGLVRVQPEGLPLMAFKQAEDQTGFVLRTYDFCGTGGSMKVGLPRPAMEVMSCDLVESNARPLPGHGKTIRVPLKPYGPVTMKVLF